VAINSRELAGVVKYALSVVKFLITAEEEK
jgi:hypothetical protein